MDIEHSSGEKSQQDKGGQNMADLNEKINAQMEQIRKEQKEGAQLVSEKLDLIILENEFVGAPNFLSKIQVSGCSNL